MRTKMTKVDRMNREGAGQETEEGQMFVYGVEYEKMNEKNR